MYLFEPFPVIDEYMAPWSDYVALMAWTKPEDVKAFVVSYYLVYRPIAIMFQVDTINLDPAKAPGLLEQQCRLSAGLVELASGVRSTRGPGTDLGLVVVADLRGECDFGVLNANDPASQRDRWRPVEPFRPENVDVTYEKAGRWLANQLSGHSNERPGQPPAE